MIEIFQLYFHTCKIQSNISLKYCELDIYCNRNRIFASNEILTLLSKHINSIIKRNHVKSNAQLCKDHLMLTKCILKF